MPIACLCELNYSEIGIIGDGNAKVVTVKREDKVMASAGSG